MERNLLELLSWIAWENEIYAYNRTFIEHSNKLIYFLLYNQEWNKINKYKITVIVI
jgi:hypothetical protein